MANVKINTGKCKYCGISFKYSKYDSAGSFCTREHYLAFKAIPENSARWFTCIECGISRKGVRKNQKYCGSRCQMNYEYKSGTRDPLTITDKAHESIKLNGQPKLRGRIHVNSPEARINISLGKIGKSVPLLQGANHWNWAGGKDKSQWKSQAYQAWRISIMRRDNFTCIQCGDNQGGNLEVDHILPVFLFPEKLLDPENGRTLCKPCHYETKTWGVKVKKLTRQDFGY